MTAVRLVFPPSIGSVPLSDLLQGATYHTTTGLNPYWIRYSEGMVLGGVASHSATTSADKYLTRTGEARK